MSERTIAVDYLARVEGEGAITIRMQDGRVVDVQLRIFEPPRLFEALLRGRHVSEPPDITSRICGVCPIAYQLSACYAIEDALGIPVGGVLRSLRRLIYMGEWIQSHGLSVFALHAPDFFGYSDMVSMAKDHLPLVRRGLRMKKAGNSIMTAVGGREIHPINLRIGGFYRAPAPAELEPLLPELEWGREAARETLEEFARLQYPDVERDYEFVAMRHPDEYPCIDGRLVSSRGLDIDVREFDAHFEERQVPYSNALHSFLRERGAYFCGPLARFNLSFDRLTPLAREAAEAIGLRPPVHNPFKSILVRLVEMIQAFDDAASIIRAYRPPAAPYVEAPARDAVGHGCTEAPRGILYHRYGIGADGIVREARIIPPTSQNQKSIELDLAAMAAQLAALPHEKATWMAEQAVRNYDPCISCATHFLKLRIEHVAP